MSKNMTRKGLAFGAMVALSATSFVALPAAADTTGPVTLVPNAGTTFNSILQSGITLKTELDPNDVSAAEAATLTFKIVNAGEASITATFTGSYETGGTTAGDVGTYAKQTMHAVDDNIVASGSTLAAFTDRIDSTVATHAVATATDKPYVWISGAVNDADDDDDIADAAAAALNIGSVLGANTLALATSVTDKNVTLVVQAFLDQDGDGFMDTFEKKSDAETVILYAPSNVTATTAIDYLVRDNSAFRYTVVYGNNINPFAVQAKTFGRLFKDGTLVDITDDASDGDGNVGNGVADGDTDDYSAAAIATATDAYTSESNIGITKNILTVGAATNGDATDFNFSATGDDVVDFGSGVYTAQAYYNTTGTTFVAVGAASPAVDLTGSTNTLVDTLDAAVATTADLKQTSNALAVRTGTKSFTVAVQAEDNSVDLKAAGIKVRATVTAVTLDSGAVTVTGSSASLVEDGVTVAYGFTNTSGIANFTINNTVGSEDDVVTAKFEILDDDGLWLDAQTITATWADAALQTWKSVGGNYVSGATVNVTFAAYDQWDQPISTDDDAALSVSAVASFGGITNATKYSKTVAVDKGVAVFSFANFATAGSSAQLVATLKAGTANATPADSGSATITVNVYNVRATDKVVVADTFSTAINYNDYVTGKLTDTAVTAAATKSGIASAASATITGNVLDVNGVGQPGVAVTIAAKGVLFKDASAYAVDTITTYANEYGSFSVSAFAHEVSTTGLAVTITADGKTASTKLKTFLPASVSDANLSFSWNFPANVVKNTTYAVTAKLTDKWGNPINANDADETAGGSDYGIAFQGTGSIEVNGVGTVVYKDFNSKGEVTVFIRSIKDIAGPGSVSASLSDAAEYNTGETATSLSTLGDVAASIAVDDTSTAWDETKWASTLSKEVDVLDVAPAPAGKVNVGSFNGKLVVYASGLNGATISWKVGGTWGKQVATSNYTVFNRPTPRAGVTVSVDIYVNGVKTLTKSVVTR